MIHQNTIKLADFGLSERIKEISKQQLNAFGTVTRQPYTSNEKSDVYSIGVLLWEISSGHSPFKDESHDATLALQILQGRRETIVPDTPIDYSNLYTGKYN